MCLLYDFCDLNIPNIISFPSHLFNMKKKTSTEQFNCDYFYFDRVANICNDFIHPVKTAFSTNGLRSHLDSGEASKIID